MTTELSPIDWARRPLQRYADFSGRAPRAEYWWYFLGTMIAYIVVMIVENIVGLDGTVGPYGPLSLILMLGLLVPGLAVTVRRLHDTNRSGWWILIAVIPYLILGILAGGAIASGSMGAMAGAGLLGLVAMVGAIVLLVFMVLPGTKGENRFGADPYGGASSTAATV
jgi:uncharacterized membrane protein YhaH (DUF805 family)